MAAGGVEIAQWNDRDDVVGGQGRYQHPGVCWAPLRIRGTHEQAGHETNGEDQAQPAGHIRADAAISCSIGGRRIANARRGLTGLTKSLQRMRAGALVGNSKAVGRPHR
jgi:hypothetical protein